MYVFEASVQLVPTFYSHPVCRLLELQLILASEEDCVQLVPKYYSKVKLRSWQPPNNETTSKWGQWYKSGSNL